MESAPALRIPSPARGTSPDILRPRNGSYDAGCVSRVGSKPTRGVGRPALPSAPATPQSRPCATSTTWGVPWAESKIKSLTGGDPISARYMRQGFFEFKPQFKLLVAGNFKPSLRSVDEAIRQRFHLIPFTVTIPPEERDRHLAAKLKPEWGAILSGPST